MTTPSEKLAQSLSILKLLQDNGRSAFRSGDISRTHRERLVKNGFLQEVMKGWYVSAKPGEAPGESTAWYAAFWGFCADYLNSRFGQSWCLSPEQSLNLHSGNWTVPRQLLVRTPKGGNKPTGLIHDTSIFDLRLEAPKSGDIVLVEDLRVMSLPAALIACPPSYYVAQPLEIRTALSMVGEPSELLRNLLEGSHSKVAGRLAGAFRNIGREKMADRIGATMKSAGYAFQETNPFDTASRLSFGNRETSPYVNRLKMMWAEFRQPIIENFSVVPGKPTNKATWLDQMDHIYTADAYHSLSIEGYRVSAALIARVQQGNWKPDSVKEDKDHLNALAARGYWQAFQAVKKTIAEVFDGKGPGMATEDDYLTWYRELFAPTVVAGIVSAADLAGYRNRPVYIRQSRHTPPSADAVRDLMPAFFESLQQEENPEVRIVLSHFMFVYIHPFIDGNGRTARFLMNLMLAAGGYPWLVIPVEKRDAYLNALESASVDKNIVPFTRFLSGLMTLQPGLLGT